MSARLVATVRDYAGLIEAFRSIKEHLQLSNATIDNLCGFTPGHTDKLLGPTCARALSPLTFNGIAWCLALKIEVSLDMERVKEMAEHWEKRNGAQARVLPSRISKVIVERAKPIVVRENGRKGGLASASKRSGSLADDCRHAGRARMRQMSRKERREFARKGGIARAAKRATSPQSEQAHKVEIVRLIAEQSAPPLLHRRAPGIAKHPAPRSLPIHTRSP